MARPSASRRVGAPTNFGGDVEIARETLDHQELLVILLAEDRDVGLRLIEELRHHRRHAGKMRRPKSVFEVGGRRPLEHDFRRKAWGIDLVDRRREDEIRGDAAKLLDIRRKRARIAGEIFIRAELRRIDENRDDDAVRRLTRRVDERQMAGVERAHRRHKADALAGGAARAHIAAQFVDGADDRRFCIHDRRPDC